MHLFYTPDINGEVHRLDEQESKHAIRVLRLQKGEEVVLVDGRGGWYEARVEDPGLKACVLSVVRKESREAEVPYELHIALSPTKNMDRFEWFLEKAVEIGITEITPLMCERTERKGVREDRLTRIMVSAMKQSLKARLPVLHPATDFATFIAQQRKGLLAIAHCEDSRRMSMKDLGQQHAYTVLVGPEGDFSPGEIKAAMDSGYTPLHLGASRLRTETAGVHVCSALQVLNS